MVFDPRDPRMQNMMFRRDAAPAADGGQAEPLADGAAVTTTAAPAPNQLGGQGGPGGFGGGMHPGILQALAQRIAAARAARQGGEGGPQGFMGHLMQRFAPQGFGGQGGPGGGPNGAPPWGRTPDQPVPVQGGVPLPPAVQAPAADAPTGRGGFPWLRGAAGQGQAPQGGAPGNTGIVPPWLRGGGAPGWGQGQAPQAPRAPQAQQGGGHQGFWAGHGGMGGQGGQRRANPAGAQTAPGATPPIIVQDDEDNQY